MIPLKRLLLVLALCLAGFVGVLGQGEDTPLLTVVTWNVESGGADPDTIANELTDFDAVDIWGLSEVDPDDLSAFVEGIAADETIDYEAVLGTTGNADSMAIVYNADRLRLRASYELFEMGDGDVRAGLVAEFEDQDTATVFLVVQNHLLRGNERARRNQASFLNDWAAEQTLPIIALGDYNFDYDVAEGEAGNRDDAYDLMVAEDIFVWVQPDVLTRTSCTVNAVEDTVPTEADCRFDSVLDFVFVAGDARDWDAYSEIVVREGDFPDTEATSDHRPIIALFEIPPF